MLVHDGNEPKDPSDVMIHVVVPFYNCQRWITRCLYSIRDQTHPKVNVVAVDDCSKDSGGTYAKMMCEANGWAYHRNEINIKCPQTLAVGIDLTNARPRDVIFLLDGDDYLPHPEVLTRWSQLFSEADIWMTYGQYMSDPPDWRCTPATTPESEDYRNIKMFFNHPIVFRKFLWDSIPKDQFKDDDGNWFQAGYDRTIIYPLMERATPEHWRFINEVAYVYNSANPISEHRLGLAEAERVNVVHSRPPLKPLQVRYVI